MNTQLPEEILKPLGSVESAAPRTQVSTPVEPFKIDDSDTDSDPGYNPDSDYDEEPEPANMTMTDEELHAKVAKDKELLSAMFEVFDAHPFPRLSFV
ncbi:hypothetical protein BDV06DRAFT_200880 [Aspergillus oleicola]